MNALNRDTTIANCLPVAMSSPAVTSPRNCAGNLERAPSLTFFSVTPCLRGELAVDPRKSAQTRGESSSPFELRRAFFEKRRRSLVLVFGRAGDAEQHRF